MHEAREALAEIIIATDATESLHELEDQLAQFGFRLEHLQRLEQVSDRLAQAPATLLVLDIDLEREGAGLELARTLSERGHSPKTLIFLSHHQDIHTRLEAVRAGAKGFLTKPLSLASLVDLFDRHLYQPPNPPKRRLLIIEDSESQRLVMQRFFELKGYEVRCLADMELLLDVIAEHEPDLLLTDLYIDQSDGFEMAQVLRQWERTAKIPIIIITGEASPEIRRRVITTGVDDYLIKPVDLHDLAAIVAGTIERSSYLQHFMHRDALTGLLNHGQIRSRLRIELKRAQRQDQPLSLVMLDLDNFKQVNDQYGHLVGDEVLRQLSIMLKHRLRATDIAGRYGGEELALILTETAGAQAMYVMERLREAFATLPFRAGENTFHVSFSYGVACWPGEDDLNALWEAADRALYGAKGSGKNSGVLALPPQRQ